MAAWAFRGIAAAALALLLLPGDLVRAQDPDAGFSQVQPGGAPKGAVVPAKKASPAKADGQAGAAGDGDASLRRRVEQLEEQLVDLQVVIGTLESLARSGGARAPDAAMGAGGLSGNDAARLEGMETQIRALTAQVELLADEVKGQGAPGRRSDAGDGGPIPGSQPPGAQAGNPPGTNRFGSTTVTSSSADGDPAGASGVQKLPDLPPVSPSPGSGTLPGAPPNRVALADPGAASNPKQLYETAYGYLLQQNYADAQAGFGDFMKKYPKDPLAPNALYWLGETHYVQRNFADAAEAFDLVATSFGSSAKAPDAQLKRAMSLAQLGQKKEACAAFGVLGSKYPNAPAHVKTKADSERVRAGCS